MQAFTHSAGQSLIIDGAELYYETVGKPAGPPVLLLHGGLGNVEDFNPIVPYLANEYRLIAIDSRGHGKSTLGSEPLSYARLQRDVEAIATQLGLARFGVIGFSDGGIVGLRMAAVAQSRVTKLVAIGTPYELRQDDPLRIILAGVTPESWIAKFPDTAALYQHVNPQPDFAALVRASVRMWIDTTGDGYPGSAVERIRCALLVARGDGDPLVSRSSACALADLVPNARLLSIPFAGHVLHADQTEMLTTSVRQFLREPPAIG